MDYELVGRKLVWGLLNLTDRDDVLGVEQNVDWSEPGLDIGQGGIGSHLIWPSL